MTEQFSAMDAGRCGLGRNLWGLFFRKAGRVGRASRAWLSEVVKSLPRRVTIYSTPYTVILSVMALIMVKCSFSGQVSSLLIYLSQGRISCGCRVERHFCGTFAVEIVFH